MIKNNFSLDGSLLHNSFFLLALPAARTAKDAHAEIKGSLCVLRYYRKREVAQAVSGRGAAGLAEVAQPTVKESGHAMGTVRTT